MDISLSEEQELLQGSARDFLQKECPIRLVRAMEGDERGYDPNLWKQMGDLGWLGLVLPEEYGSGATMMDLVVLLEEFGRALVPGPFVPTVAASRTASAVGRQRSAEACLLASSHR